MSYAAEPYEVFVEDLLGNLTGAISRIRLTFRDDLRPFEIGTNPPARPRTVRVHGLAGGEYRRFVEGTDFTFADGVIEWLEERPGVRSPTATWPDDGSDFWVGFEPVPGSVEPPVLTDRNEGSITRTLAESMALEFAVVAHQLEAVYESAHLSTAAGKDLDHVVELVGITRRGQLHARGAVTLRRSSPAPADVTIPAGTLVSTAEPPQVTAETTETVTLRRGTLAVNAPVRAQADGPSGVAAARSLTVLHRPILGIEEVVNTQALTFGGSAESDAELRRRAARSLETNGRSTVAAITGALASVDGIREQDVLVEEDHLAFPGVVKIVITGNPDDTTKLAASRALEQVRPAGIRLVHDLPAPSAVVPIVGDTEPGGGGDAPTGSGAVVDEHDFPIALRAVVTPASTELTDLERNELVDAVIGAIETKMDELGVGQPVVYNSIVATIMQIAGVLDVVVDIAPAAGGAQPSGRVNLRPPSGTRALLVPAERDVTLGGALVALDVSVVIQRLGSSATADPTSAIQAARTDIADRLRAGLLSPPATITPAALLGILTDTDDYSVRELHYTAELLEEGLLIERTDVPLDMSGAKQPWIRLVVASENVVTT